MEMRRSEEMQPLRVLLFSDLLLDGPYTWAPASVAEARRAAAREALVEILAAARRHHADLVACAGDLFDRRTVRPSTVQWLITAFRSVNVPVLISPGNRDFIGPLGGYFDYDWSENVTVFRADRFTPVEASPEVFVWGAAHTEAHRMRSFFDGFRVDRDGIHIALFHGSERGGFDREPRIDPCAMFDEHAIEAAGFDHALVGHYQQANFGRTYTYSGAAIAHHFGARDSGGAALISVGHDGAIDREFLPIASPPLRAVEADVTGAQSTRDVLERAKLALADGGGAIRLTLHGRLAPSVVVRREDILRLADDPDQLMIEWNVQVDVDVDQLAEESTIRGQFVRDVLTSTDMTDERRQRILLIGLRTLAGSDVLEAPR
jgi:DNA repair protein SbcD/Mre11